MLFLAVGKTTESFATATTVRQAISNYVMAHIDTYCTTKENRIEHIYMIEEDVSAIKEINAVNLLAQTHPKEIAYPMRRVEEDYCVFRMKPEFGPSLSDVSLPQSLMFTPMHDAMTGIEVVDYRSVIFMQMEIEELRNRIEILSDVITKSMTK